MGQFSKDIGVINIKDVARHKQPVSFPPMTFGHRTRDLTRSKCN